MFEQEYFESRTKLSDNRDALNVFQYLQQPESIASMLAFSAVKLPAITGLAMQLEQNYANCPDFPLSNYQNRQITGRMVKFILGKFGYTPVTTGLEYGTRLRDFAGARFFKTSAVYEKKDIATHELILEIRPTQ